MTTQEDSAASEGVPTFFEARIRNQASNIIRTVFGQQDYPAQSAKGELEDLITTALLAAHRSVSPSVDEAAVRRAADKIEIEFPSLPNYAAKRIVEIITTELRGDALISQHQEGTKK